MWWEGEKKELRIDSSTIGMESARSYKASNVTVRRFTIMDYQQSLAQNSNSLNAAVQEEKENEEDKKAQNAQNAEQGTASVEEWYNRMSVTTSRVSIRNSGENVLSDIRQYTIRYIFDLLFADRRERFKEWLEDKEWTEQSPDAQFSTNFKVLNYTQENWQMEREETSFSTVGTVKTADGREINFNVNVGMSREFQQYYSEELDLASFKMCDPLVINLDTDVAELADQNFYFDIDADGEQDEIAQLSGGSGYLALDKNSDGTINDGNELFGTKSGNGFADLAKYDEDGNGWIDEGDAIWSKLKIWCKNEKGEDVLYKLADKGVGAICLQNAATDFTLKGDSGQTKGAIRNTGIFLYENGNVGTVQHIDVAKYQKQA